MGFLEPLSMAFGVALEPTNLLVCFIGVLIGTLVGVLPGLGRSRPSPCSCPSPST